MGKEFEALLKNGVWELVSPPKHEKNISDMGFLLSN